MMHKCVSSLALAVVLCAAHGAAGAVTHVFDTARVGKADVVVLRNGDRLSGTVSNGAWNLETRYGPVTLNPEFLAGLRFGRERMAEQGGLSGPTRAGHEQRRERSRRRAQFRIKLTGDIVHGVISEVQL